MLQLRALWLEEQGPPGHLRVSDVPRIPNLPLAGPGGLRILAASNRAHIIREIQKVSDSRVAQRRFLMYPVWKGDVLSLSAIAVDSHSARGSDVIPADLQS